MIPLLLAAALVIEVAGSVCVVTGYQARMAAFVMFWYTTAVTVLFHNYWAASEAMAGMQETHFRKNLGIMGGLLMLAYRWTRKMGVGAASRFLTGSGLHFGCPGLACCPTNTTSGEKPMRDVPTGMDAPRRIQRKADSGIGPESKAGEMVFHAGLVRDSRGAEMGHSAGGPFLEDHRLGAGSAARTLQVGDEKHVIGLRKPDDRRGSIGFEHLSDGRV